MNHQTFLEHENFRYLKVAIWLCLISIIAYALHRPDFGAYGGTWLGYTLGCLSAAIVFLHHWLGIRKRQYRGIGTLKGWLSAHIYLGAALIVLATLHTGFQFGWNIHTLTYGLMMFLIVNGFYGLYAYLHFPRMITENLGEFSQEELLNKIVELDEMARVHALQLPDDVNAVVMYACQDTEIGGGIVRQLIGRRRDCPTSLAVQKLREFGKDLKGDQPRLYRELYLIMLQKEALVAKARRNIMLKANLEIWLYLHIPLSIALFVALIAHIFSTFFYW